MAENGGTELSNTSTNLITNKAITSFIYGAIKRSYVEVWTTFSTGTEVNPTIPSGYTFLCWLTPQSSGSVEGAYMEDCFQSHTKIWQTTRNHSGSTFFKVGFLMVKTNILG